jgi:gluconolactonase
VTIKLKVILLGLLAIYSEHLFSQATPPAPTTLFEPNSIPQLISNQFSFTEGPAVDKSGNVFFTDQPNNKIWKYSTDGKLTVFLENAGRSNGMYFDKKGNLVTCADEKNQIWSITPKGKVTVLMNDYKGHRLNGPNDVWVHPNGGIYFTDPYYQRNYWERKSPDTALRGEKVYYLPKGKTEPVVIDDSIKKPNGIVGTPDGRVIFVSDIGSRKVYKYNLNKDGSVYNRLVFAEELVDGMTLDERGNLYLAGNGITIYNWNGKKINQIPVPSKWTANLCFAGKDRNKLFITASESVYILPMNVKGMR